MPLAHAGHWLVETLYVAPVVVIVLWISAKTVIDRRREAREGPAPATASADPGPEPRA